MTVTVWPSRASACGRPLSTSASPPVVAKGLASEATMTIWRGPAADFPPPPRRVLDDRGSAGDRMDPAFFAAGLLAIAGPADSASDIGRLPRAAGFAAGAFAAVERG